MPCCFSDFFCEFFNFSINFAMQHHWATAYLFLFQMVTLAGYMVFSGHLVIVAFLENAIIEYSLESLSFSLSLSVCPCLCVCCCMITKKEIDLGT